MFYIVYNIEIGSLVFDTKNDFPNSKMLEFNTKQKAQNFADKMIDAHSGNFIALRYDEYMDKYINK